MRNKATHHASYGLTFVPLAGRLTAVLAWCYFANLVQRKPIELYRALPRHLQVFSSLSSD